MGDIKDEGLSEEEVYKPYYMEVYRYEKVGIRWRRRVTVRKELKRTRKHKKKSKRFSSIQAFHYRLCDEQIFAYFWECLHDTWYHLTFFKNSNRLVRHRNTYPPRQYVSIKKELKRVDVIKNIIFVVQRSTSLLIAHRKSRTFMAQRVVYE